ncbi:MAG: hypothetical protein QG650_1155 [Patescibacteria group bacterium]|nr:hypothetical protein [Patescibacteria group bacterium]
MKLVPDFISRLVSKPTRPVARAKGGVDTKDLQGVFAKTSPDLVAHEFDFTTKPAMAKPRVAPTPLDFEIDVPDEKPRGRFFGLDAKNLILAVSLAVNIGLVYDTVSQKNAAMRESDALKDQVATLKIEKQKMQRESVGKIRVKEDEMVVPVEQINAAVEYVEVLKNRVAELEAKAVGKQKGGKIAASRASVERVSVAKTATTAHFIASDVSAPTTVHAEAAPTAQRNPKLFQKASDTVKSIASDIPQEISLKVSQNAGLTTVTYSDASGFTRYFTADRSENASKLTPKGLQAWVNEKYMASLDIQRAKQEDQMRKEIMSLHPSS